ncbi:MAG: hypothetical protein HY860_05895 [Chlamydiales bacterium]|nr:hypothetical protein [Chlamydiales bacterium]
MDNKNHLKMAREVEKTTFHPSIDPLKKEFIFKPISQDSSMMKHSDLFQQQGQKLLLDGDSGGLKFFDMAVDLDPTNADLLYEQGLALFEFGSEKGKEKNLVLASGRFKKATKLDASHFDAWFAWGQTLYHLGKSDYKYHYFLDAKSKFQKALSLSSKQENDIIADLYWLIGCTMFAIAANSQEVSDLNASLEYFSLAAAKNPSLPADFWRDFGASYEKLGMQINDNRLFLKAVDCYKRATALSPTHSSNWFCLANGLYLIYTATHDEDNFSQANECFATAAQIQPDELNIWLSWGKILFESGKRLSDTRRLFSAIEKCHRANSCQPCHYPTISLWSESLATLGIILDRVDLIHDAENKIQEIIHLADIGPDVWHAYGMCLYAYATYYDDLDYYYQAIEKFQSGLSIDRTSHALWFALGITYSQAAELESDPAILELACKFFARALHLCGKSLYHFEYALALSKIGEFHGDQHSLEVAIYQFEQALRLQKNAIYLYPEWLYQYALTLDSLADYNESSDYYQKAIEILSHVLVIDPEHPEVHYRLALCYSHYGELSEEFDLFLKAIYHYRLAYKKDDENDIIILDWALTLINMAELAPSSLEKEQLLKESEYKIIQAIKSGNIHGYYHLACLYSIVRDFRKSIFFLEKAKNFHGLPTIDELLQDSWLDNLRDTSLFQDFISKIEKSSDVN